MQPAPLNTPDWIQPDWPAPSWVHAYSTTRQGGVSQPPYDDFNLAAHVGDEARAVQANRIQLMQTLELPAPPTWLRQVHGATVVNAAEVDNPLKELPDADGAYSDRPRVVCAVLTADCLPLLLCDRAGMRVAAVHVGWRGLAAGVIEAGVQSLSSAPPGELMAWMGPAIGAQAFEVGAEVHEQLVGQHAPAAQAFQPARSGHWLADIYQLTRQRLQAQGVTAIYGGGYCTVSDAARFYSYRRDGITGRMATLIWVEAVASS